MKIDDKIIGGSYTSAEFTEFKNESQNAIESNGEALDAGDRTQLGKSIQTSAGAGDFYSSTFAAGQYQLVGPSGRLYPNNYKDGLRIRFVIDTDNTGAGDTIKVGTLEALPMSTRKLANGETPTIDVGYLVAGQVADFIYETTPDLATAYWRVASIKIDRLESGIAVLDKDSEIKIGSAAPTGTDAGAVVKAGEVFVKRAGASNEINTAISLKATGLSSPDGFNGGVGLFGFDGRPAVYPIDIMATGGSVSAGVFITTADLILTGIPNTAIVYGVTIHASDPGTPGKDISMSMNCLFKNGTSFKTIDSMEALFPGLTYADFTVGYLTIWYKTI